MKSLRMFYKTVWRQNTCPDSELQFRPDFSDLNLRLEFSVTVSMLQFVAELLFELRTSVSGL